MRKVYLYIICILFCRITLAQSQLEKIKFSRIDVNSGLSNSNVTCFLQDSKGFMWVGTEDGLNKYDGYDFTVYRNDIHDVRSILKNNVQYIFEDIYKTIWVSTLAGGLHYYDRALDKFIRIDEFTNRCSITQIVEDFQHDLWIGGSKNGYAFTARFNRVNKKWEKHNLFQSLEPLNCIIPESENEFWIGVWKKGLFKWNSKTNKIENYAPDKKNPNTILGKNIYRLIKDKGTLWIAMIEGLSKFDTKTKKFTNYTTDNSKLPVNTIRDMELDNHYLWLATENGGLVSLNIHDNSLIDFVSDRNDLTSLSDNSVWSVYKDKQNRIWVGTFSKGICIIDKLRDKFSELDINLSNNIVNAIFEDSKNRIWIGTEGGLAVKNGNKIQYYSHNPEQKGSLSSDPVLCIYEDSKQRMWFGNWRGGINRFDEKTNSFVSYLSEEGNPESLSNSNVYSIHEYSKTKELYVSSYNGLNILKDEKKGIFAKHYENEYEPNNYIKVIYEDSKSNIWLGCVEELNIYDPIAEKTDRITSYKLASSNRIRINCIYEDKKKRLWVGGATGLYQVKDRKYVKRYTIKDGLPNNIIRGILEDNKGNLWLSTTQGISMFDPEKNTFTNYDVNDGLLSNEFKANSCFKSKDGQFFFGGTGINIFYPDSIKKNPYLPEIYFTDLKLVNKSVVINDKNHVLKQHITETKEIYLDYLYNFFTINYVAINFTSSNKNQYAYKLEGFDKDWNNVGNQRSATFTNLDPGVYTFRIKASNNDGIWNEKGASLVIHILPPWWKTIWFRILLGIAVVGCIILYNLIRIRTVKQQNKKLEILVTERTKELHLANQELVAREEEIKSQNEELYEQREEVAAQNEELIQSQEEVEAQRDLVSEQNKKLEQATAIIEEQNKEILKRNETLEEDVRKRTKDLIEYNQQLEQFAFITAHNLRAPVARILGLGQVMDLNNKNPDEQKMLLGKLIFTTEELDKVVKDLNVILDIRKNNDSIITEIDLKEELELIKINLEKEILDTETQIVADFSAVNKIQAVKPYIDSILLNLVSNAIKYRYPDRKPVIRIITEILDDYICIELKDNGLGIDLDLYQDKLFTLYKRFHLHIEGKGMGLYIVKTQVASLGGKIEVESKVNEGTAFKIFLKIKPLLQS